MRSGFVGSILGVVAVLAFSPGILAQTAQQSGVAKTIPGLSGVWESLRSVGNPLLCRINDCDDLREVAVTMGKEPSMQPWAAEKYKLVRKGVTDPNAPAPDEVSPVFNCFPPGPIRIFSRGRTPFEIRQFPDVVFLLFETDHWVRRIYMDGRGHPNGYPITWMGHSIGNYDRDTLVVDTVSINDKSWIDNLGHPHSDAMHLVERFRRVNDILELEFTIDDPKAYTSPWIGKKLYQLMPPGWEVMEDVACEERLEMGTKRGTRQ